MYAETLTIRNTNAFVVYKLRAGGGWLYSVGSDDGDEDDEYDDGDDEDNDDKAVSY